MGISIKHDEYERLIRQLADQRGTSITDTIGLAVKRELDRDASSKAEAEKSFVERIKEIQVEVAKFPILDPRAYREILYDEDGLPK